MNKYITTIRASVALAAVATLVAFAPQANAALTKAQSDSVKAAKTSKSALLAAAKAIVANATDKTQAAKDVAALVATEAPGMAGYVVGGLSLDNKAAAPGIAAAAAQANSSVAVDVAKAAAVAAPAYAVQINSQVIGVVSPTMAQAITTAVTIAMIEGMGKPQQLTFGANPADVSTSAR